MASPSGGASLRVQRVRLAVTATVGAVAVVALGLLADPIGAGAPDEPTAADGASWLGPDPVGPLISEVVSSNASTLTDEDGDQPDWIELYNPTGEPLDLGGYHLSDDEDDPARWALPPVVLEPHGYLIVFASGKDRRDPAGELHTDFRLAQGEEPVLLIEPDGGTVADRLPAVEIPRNASFGRQPGQLARTCYFALPSPGARNTEECFDDTDLGAPTLSQPSGFYDEPFDLEITAPGPDPTIYYTLDGSYPDPDTNPERTRVYDGPLRLDDPTGPGDLAVRDATVTDPAIAYFEGRAAGPDLDGVDIERVQVLRARTRSSAESSATYLIGPERRRDQLPILSLVLDPDHLFDHDHGIYVAGRTFEEYRLGPGFDPDARWDIPTNYNQRGRAWERPALDDLHNATAMHLCLPEVGCPYQRNIGIRTHGGFSRQLPQKSLRLYARNDYGDRRFSFPVFLDQPELVGHRRLILRNSGNDNGRLMFRDAYVQSLLDGMAADTQAYQPTVVFINGEYWGVQNLRDRYDVHYLEVVHGADPGTVELLDNSGGPLEGSSPDAIASWTRLVHRVADARSVDVEPILSSSIDLDSMFDHIIAHTFTGNWDWSGNNERWWREPAAPRTDPSGTLDGRWRWLLADFDQLGNGVGSYDLGYDAIEDRLRTTDDPMHRDGLPLLFERAMEVAELRQRFVDRFQQHLNTTFHPERTSTALERTADPLADEMARHTVRWQLRDISQWHAEIEQLRAFMAARPAIQRDQLRERFALGDDVQLGVAPEADQGRVTVEAGGLGGDVEPLRWTGTYASGSLVQLTAEPDPGHRFAGWVVNGADRGADRALEVHLDADTEVVARFEPAA